MAKLSSNLCRFSEPPIPARPVFLLGAGASFSSGVTLADEAVRRLAKRVYADRVLRGAISAFRVKTSEWERWLGLIIWD
jgi:hypothetical protein